MTNHKKLISIVTPCYNEELNVHQHFEKVCKAIDPFRQKYEFEHIYTDNCSQDNTFELLCELSSRFPMVRVLRFSRNIGADRAISFGLQHSKGDAVIVIQADLQDPPELIEQFIAHWQQGYDIIYGKISTRKEKFILRTLRRIYYKIIAKLSDVPIAENAGEFRLTSRRALNAILEFKESDLYMRGVVAQVGYRQKAISYVRQERAAGKSSVNFIYLVGYAVNALLSTTVVPIRMVTVSGILISILGFFLSAYVILTKFIFPNEAPQGFTTIVSLLTFFAGAQLFALGIIGEYVRKTYVQTLKRPRGFVQDKINFEQQ